MYFRLTYRTAVPSPSDPTGTRRAGDSILCGQRQLDIGQLPSCDVRIPESDIYEPLLAASILPCHDGDGWYIVRRSDHLDIKVGSYPLEVAQVLATGDVLTISDGSHNTVLKFDIFTDSDYDEASGVVYHHRAKGISSPLLAVGMVLLAAGIVAVALLAGGKQDLLRHADFDRYTSSLYHIMTDSVYLVRDTVIDGRREEVVEQAIALQEVRSATCFLTTDGYFVTARHCVEPWVDNESWDGVAFSPSTPPEVRLSAMAETGNRLCGDNRYTVRAHCVVSSGLECYDYLSTDFIINRTRDLLLPLGTSHKPIYLRTIIPVAHKRDMELGDFAYLKAPEGLEGQLTMASADELKAFDHQADKDIAVLGFPVNDNDAAEHVKNVFGNSQHIEYSPDGHPAGCIQMSAAINPGNSGGPILARIGGKIKVIGIVSKADMHAVQGTFWAVPISEVERMIADGNKAVEDTMLFIR